MKKVVAYVCVFIMTVTICVAMLLMATFAPQKAIDQNLIESADRIVAEGVYPMPILEWRESAILDNHTDALILMQSKAMVRDSQSTILTNPMYISGDDNMVEALEAYAWSEKPEPTGYYTRYWMGFRAIVRWLLVFLNDYQIRQYLIIVFYALLFLLLGAMAKHLDGRHAVIFAACMFAVCPYANVIGSSFQYSCCFFIAFLTMLLIPWLEKNPRFQGVFFMVVGMLTMFFDFYTIPLITFGLPMIYLSLIRIKKSSAGGGGYFENRTSVAAWLPGNVGVQADTDRTVYRYFRHPGGVE